MQGLRLAPYDFFVPQAFNNKTMRWNYLLHLSVAWATCVACAYHVLRAPYHGEMYSQAATFFIARHI